ncbi:MAG TPA: rhomboid family intramembrane serine protease [Bryobacteraceae bacterium]|nr:rhomboid family intramembrane serine protease [Bryobacteraceae bacterium]
MEKRRMCPNCRAFITISDRVCPYCGAQLGPRAVDLRASRLAASFLPRANLSSVIVLIINVAFFIAEIVLGSHFGNASAMNIDPRAVILLGAEYPSFVTQGQWWRLITAGFLHGGLLHIAMNSWSLFILVTEVEQFYGTARLIVAYVVSTFIGFYFAYRFGTFALGASAAAFGMFGIMLAMGLRERANPLVQAIRAHYGQWLVIGLVLSLGPGISMAAHLGGLLGGFIVGAAGGLPGFPNTPREMLWKILAAAAILVTVYCFFLDLTFFSRMLSNT